mgnify:CR=1 FL=1
MTLSRGLTSRQLFFLSAAYLFSGFCVFRTRGISDMVFAFLLWSLFSGVAFMIKQSGKPLFSSQPFRTLLAACSAVAVARDVFSLYLFSSLDNSGVPPIVFTLSLVGIAVFIAYRIKLVGRLAELTPYIFAIVLLTSVPYMKVALSLFAGEFLSPLFFPSAPLLLCAEVCETESSPSLAAEKRGLHPLILSILGALLGALLYIPFSAADSSKNGLISVFVWTLFLIRLSMDIFSAIRLCKEKSGCLPTVAFASFIFVSFAIIAKNPLL